MCWEFAIAHLFKESNLLFLSQNKSKGNHTEEVTGGCKYKLPMRGPVLNHIRGTRCIQFNCKLKCIYSFCLSLYSPEQFPPSL